MKRGKGKKKTCLHGFFAEEEAVNRLTGEGRRGEGEKKNKSQRGFPEVTRSRRRRRSGRQENNLRNPAISD